MSEGSNLLIFDLKRKIGDSSRGKRMRMWIFASILTVKDKDLQEYTQRLN
jgi:hypothetical protein